MKTKLSEFRLDPATRVWSPGVSASFAYSDGDGTENKILDIVQRSTDVSLFSRELIASIDDWATEYHFSPRRANLIRILEKLDPSTRILELGCGCGAITKAFAERGCSVDAVEGSHRRASIAATRVKEHDKVRVHVANFQDIEFEPIYDLVTLIGVLEYSPAYINGEDPFVACLKMATSALKPGGTLLIAIENKLGLKYFSGITEDHFSIAYYGIEGRYRQNETTTYGKKQLTEKLINAGLSEISYFFPFPDYKLPEVVLSEAALEEASFNVADLISELENRDYSQRGRPHFLLNLAWQSVSHEGLISELANSFLILAGKGPTRILVDRSVIAQKFTDNRVPAFDTVTRFLKDGSDIKVKKDKLAEIEASRSSSFQHVLATENYVRGRNLVTELKHRFVKGHTDGINTLIRSWVAFLEANSDSNQLDGSWFDAIPANIIIARDGSLQYIDREWHLGRAIDLNVILSRGLWSIANDRDIAPLVEGENRRDKSMTLARNAGLPFFASDYEVAEALNAEAWIEIYGRGEWNAQHYRSSPARDPAKAPRKPALDAAAPHEEASALPATPAPVILDPRLLGDRQRHQTAARMVAEGRIVEGGDQLIALAQADTPVWEVYCDLGTLAAMQGDRQTARELFNVAMAKAGEPTRANLEAATIEAAAGHHETALELLSPYLRKRREDFDALDLARKILGASRELSPVAWARLITDLRGLAPASEDAD
jgi:SAM-dependent methyltransferase